MRRRRRVEGVSVAACIPPVREFDAAGALDGFEGAPQTGGQTSLRTSTALPWQSVASRAMSSVPPVASSAVASSAVAAEGGERQEPAKELSDWATVKEMLSYVKPRNNRDTAMRLSAAFGLLIASKGLNVQVPFIFKHVVDALSEGPTGLTPATIGTVVALTPPMLVVSYGVSRIGASLCNEMRNAVFAKVISGMDVVDRIAGTPTTRLPNGMTDVPQKPVMIESVKILSKEQAMGTVVQEAEAKVKALEAELAAAKKALEVLKKGGGE